MKKLLIAAAMLGGLSVSTAHAQVELKTYADANGSFGLTTLERRHVRRRGDDLSPEFSGEAGQFIRAKPAQGDRIGHAVE